MTAAQMDYMRENAWMSPKLLMKGLEKLEKEQARQAKELEKLNDTLRKQSFALERANQDIKDLNDRVNSLYGLLDLELLEQAGTIPGSKTDIKCQKKIITLTQQIRATESSLAKAKYTTAEAERTLRSFERR